jgi:glucose/arabinose dehydrogenase/streptogramin lyase
VLRSAILISGIFYILLNASMASAQEFGPTTSWGSYGQERDSRFNAAEGIAVDQQGNVYVADTGNDRIQKFSPNGTFIGELGRHGVQNGTFKNPEGIAVDQQGNVYVADTGNDRIQKFSGNFSGNFSAFSPNGTFIGELGRHGVQNGTFKNPEGIAVDQQGNVYVADTGNDRIQKFSGNFSGNFSAFSPNGTYLTQWGEHGVEDSRFNGPEGIAVDQQGNVYVADTGNNRIQKFSGDGTFIGNFGLFGTNDGAFDAPEAIAVDQQGNMYVADTGNNRIQKFSSSGTFLGKFGSFGPGEDQLKYPSAVAVDSRDNIFIVDTSNNRVSVIRTLPEGQVGTSAQSNNMITVNDPMLKVERIAADLSYNTHIAFLGQNDILLLAMDDSNGAVFRMVGGEILPEPLLTVDLGAEPRGCICGIDVQKNSSGATNVFLFYYVKKPDNNSGQAGIYVNKYELVDDKLINPKTIFYVPQIGQSIHNGGGLSIGPDQNVYFIIGELDTHRTRAQNFIDGPEPDGSSAIIRITTDGKPLEDNPLGGNGILRYYYAYGIRNGFGLAFDPVTHKLWDTENGPNYGDEINVVDPGFNSGWSRIQGVWAPKLPGENDPDPARSNITNFEDFDGKGKYSPPEFTWYRPNAPTGLAFLNSEKLGKKYENDLFVGDFNSGNLYRFELNSKRDGLILNGSLADKVANDFVERDQAIFASGFGGITDVKVGPDGYLYIVSLNQGAIYKIVPTSEANATSLSGQANTTDIAGLMDSTSGLVTTPVVATFGGKNIPLNIIGTSAAGNFSFDEENRKLSFTLSAEDRASGTIIIPLGYVLRGPYTVVQDGNIISDIQVMSNPRTGVTTLKFDYEPATHEIVVIGTELIPEFSMTLIGILIVTPISAIIILSRSNNILKIHRS